MILLGDFNCPGGAPDAFDDRLTAWLSCYDLTAVSEGPTHMHFNGSLSRLDVIAEPSNPRRLSTATTVLTGFSDHRLLTSDLDCARPPSPKVTYSYPDLKRLDIVAFRRFLRCSKSVKLPSDDPDEIARQLDNDLTLVLDRFAPLR